MKDICFYVADNDMRQGIEGLIYKLFPEKKLSEFCDFVVESQHDAGIYNKAGSFLRKFLQQYRYVMVFLDREGSGQERKTCEEIERRIKEEIVYNGWGEDTVQVIVFDPELEIWLWVESESISQELGWDSYQELKENLIEERLWDKKEAKPRRAKEAMEFALKEKGRPRSSSIYKKIAKSITTEIFCQCQDNSFRKFVATLERWYDKNWLGE